MKKKKLYKIAKNLLANSLTGGYVDEKKVKNILDLLKKNKPSGLISILKIYKRLISRAINKEQIIFESAQVVQEKKLQDELIARAGAKRIIYKVNPKIVFGAKITHGDWIFDATLDSRLKQLTTDY